MGKWKLDSSGIGAATRECRSHVLRPFILGGAALLAATVWMVTYSVIVLPLGTAEDAREIAQVVISVATLALLIYLGYPLYKQLRQNDTSSPLKITGAEEEALNAEKVGLVDSVFPRMDDNMMKAWLLAIVPFASVIESLLG
jgi:hypothetical protein